MRRWGLVLGTGWVIGCASAPEGVDAEVVPASVQGLATAGRSVDPAWLAAAEVWVVAEFAEGTYPCVDTGAGLDMFERHLFTPRRVLRGEVRARAIDVRARELRGANYPGALRAGGVYLVLLRPSEATRRVLGDPAGVFVMETAIGPDEVVAIVELADEPR